MLNKYVIRSRISEAKFRGLVKYFSLDLEAVKIADGSVEAERKWQNEQLPEEIRELVLSAMREKERHFKLEK